MTKEKPIISLVLPRPVFKVSFLDEYSPTDTSDHALTNLRWVAQLDNASVVILNLSYTEGENLRSRFGVNVIFNTDITNRDSSRHFAMDYAIGSSGGFITWISLHTKGHDQLPIYTIAPIRARDDPPKSVPGGNHISAEQPMTIPRTGLPFQSSVSCLDFDDGHGLLLIGSDAGQFCLVNFANALLPDEAVYGALPVKEDLDGGKLSKVVPT